jgi:hypothetical protein
MWFREKNLIEIPGLHRDMLEVVYLGAFCDLELPIPSIENKKLLENTNHSKPYCTNNQLISKPGRNCTSTSSGL